MNNAEGNFMEFNQTGGMLDSVWSKEHMTEFVTFLELFRATSVLHQHHCVGTQLDEGKRRIRCSHVISLACSCL